MPESTERDKDRISTGRLTRTKLLAELIEERMENCPNKPERQHRNERQAEQSETREDRRPDHALGRRHTKIG
jgi:hypothetical protein